jgi:hypothetical protein
MNRILTALVLSTLVTSAALAQAGVYGPRGQVYCNGAFVGQDPDTSIRAQLLKDCGSPQSE